jgi:hypothetical protein
MATDHVAKSEKAHDQLVAQRRSLATSAERRKDKTWHRPAAPERTGPATELG